MTADKGLADVRGRAPDTHHGILLLRPDRDGIRPVIELMRSVLVAHDLSSLARSEEKPQYNSPRVAVATPRGIARPPYLRY